jgi:type II secretion system protein D
MARCICKAGSARWIAVLAVVGAISVLSGKSVGQDASESAPAEIRFAFKDASFEQVIEFFSRATGLPVVWETSPPDGTLNYLGPESYNMDEALQVLNIILQSKGVMLRVSDDMLYLQKLSEMQRENIPTFVGELPAEVTDDEIITVVRPLNLALAGTLVSKLKELVASYGSITAMEQQNSLIITETAAQVRRLLKIVEELDREDPDGSIEIFSISNAQARDLMQPLKALLSQRIEKYVINQEGKQVKIEEETLPGLSITADERTNSIVAKGVKSRIDKLRTAIELLDVPAVNQARTIRTFALAVHSPEEAAKRLQALYARLPKDQRPTVIALSDVGRVTVIGDERMILEGEALLREIDGGGQVDASDAREISVVVLEHADPANVSTALQSLLNDRQLVATRVVIGPDGHSLIVAGTAADVAAIKAVVPALDRPRRLDRQARLLQLSVDDPATVVNRARELYARQVDKEDPAGQVDAQLDAEAGTVTIVGAAAALDRFAQAMRMVEETVVVDIETRQIELDHARPSALAGTLSALAPRLLQPQAGQAYTPPSIESIDDLNLLIVSARPAQLTVLETLVQGLDVPPDAVPPLRILQLRTADAANLASALTAQYNQRSAEDRADRPARISADSATNTILVAAHPELLAEIQAIAEELNQAGRFDEEGREIRIFPLTVARAEELAQTIDAMFPAPPVPLDYRGRPMPHLQEPREVVVRADTQTNALIVDAPLQRMAHFEKLVEQLDRQRIAAGTEVRTFVVVHADLQALAATLRELAAAGALSESGVDRSVEVTISVSPLSRTLVVSGPADIFERVDQVLGELDVARTGPGTALRFYALQHASAERLAPMLREVLLTRLAADVPNAGVNLEALLNVAADRATNTLIISVPAAMLPVTEQLIEQLDREATSATEPVIRVRPLEHADVTEVSDALRAAMSTIVSPATGDPMDLRIIPTPGSNALVLVGLETDLEVAEQLIEPLDVRPVPRELDVRTFALKHAEAADLAPVISKLLVEQQRAASTRRRGRAPVDPAPPVRVEADRRTNSILVSGSREATSLAEILVEQLDGADDGGESVVRFYVPERADPEALVSVVQRIMETMRVGPRQRPLLISAERAAGTVVVVGSSRDAVTALDLLARWDEQAIDPPEMDLQVIPLTNADPRMIADALTMVLRDQSRWPEGLRRLARAGASIGTASVIADPEAPRVLVSAPQALMPLARQLIEQIDQPPPDLPASRSLEVRVFALNEGNAADVASAVQAALAASGSTRPGEPAATITAEPTSNSLLVSATPDRIVEIETMVTSLDRGAVHDQAQVRTVFLKHAQAETVAPVVSDLLGGEQLPLFIRMEAARRGRELPRSGPEVRVIADPRLNAIVIAAPAAILNIAQELVDQLDVDPAQVGATALRTVHVLAIDNADAGTLAQNLQVLFDNDQETAPPPLIRVDAGSNSLLIRATREQFERIEAVTTEIDAATMASSLQMRLVPIDASKASAQEVADTLRRMFDQRRNSRVEVITLEELWDRQSNEQAIEESVDEPVSTLPLEALTPVVALSAMADDDLESALAAGDLVIAVDPETNSLIVLGSSRSVQRAQDLAQQIQDQVPAAPSTIHAIALPDQIDANTLAGLANQVLAQLTPPGGRAGDLRRRVVVLPDRVTNALIVASNDRDFQIVGELIGAISRPGDAEPVIMKVYPLENVSAERAAGSVRDLFSGSIQPRGRQTKRMRRLALKVIADGQEIEAVLDPGRVSVSTDDRTNALIVMAPPSMVGFLDQFVELLDQSTVARAWGVQLFALRHAQAEELRRILRELFAARFRSQRQRGASPSDSPPEIIADKRTNTIIASASPDQLAEIQVLIGDLDVELGETLHPLRIVELEASDPSQAARLLDQVVIGTDQQRRASTLIAADSSSGRLLIRADDTVMGEIESVLAEIDREATSGLEVRTLEMQRADAGAVAEALQRFFDDRARIASEGRGRRAQTRRVSIVGDPFSSTLLVAASDEDFAQIEGLVAQFDTAEAAGTLEFRVFPLEHARVADVENVIDDLVEELFWKDQGSGFFWNPRPERSKRQRGIVAIRGDRRLNALIVTGEGDHFDVIEKVVAMLDAPDPRGVQRVVRIYRVRNIALNVVAEVVRELYSDTTRRRWQEVDPNEVKVQTDNRTGTLVVLGSPDDQEEIAKIVESIDAEGAADAQKVTVIPVKFAQAEDLRNTLTRFMRDRARATGAPVTTTTIAASNTANALVISAPMDELATIRDLLTRLDQADATGDRTIEIIALGDADVAEISRIVSEQFSRRGGPGVIVTPDLRTNSIIINAPRQQFEQVRALVERLDTPGAADETVIRTYALGAARAEDAARVLGETLQLNDRGETVGITIKLENSEVPATEVKAKIVADRRSNSLIITATQESYPVIEELIGRLDTVPTVSPVEYRIIPLDHVIAADVAFTLRSFTRRQTGDDEATPEPRIDYNRTANQLIVAATADQFDLIETIIDEIDRPSATHRVTDFVPLRFAEAEQVQQALSVFYGPMAIEADTPGKVNVRIVADPATNSLVISADEGEWDDILALLAKLDSEEYDSSLQLRVLPLDYADARSVARAINEAFRGIIERERGPSANNPVQGDERREGQRPQPQLPTVLVEAEEWVRAAAEPQTNSVIVSAGRQTMAKIEHIVAELDNADYAKLPPPRLIRVESGDPVQLAQSLRELYLPQDGEGFDQAIRIIGDVSASTIIVRAEDEAFTQLQALAEALQQESAERGISVQVIRLASAPAQRVAEAIQDAYDSKAKQAGQPLAIQVDVAGNALVVASTAMLFEEIKETVKELDALSPGGGKSIFVIDLEHVSPDEAQSVIETIGLDKPVSDDSAGRLVSEPITVTQLPGRNTIVVVANPVDRDTVLGLLKTIDTEPGLAAAQTRVYKLHNAVASAMTALLEEVLRPAEQQSGTALAEAVKEQLRRLQVRRNGLNEVDFELDLTTPIRIVPDDHLNAIVVASTPANVAAVGELIHMFDALPITGAVNVQIVPLQNIAAEDFARVVRELFEQGESLSRVTGTDIQGMPSGSVGAALLESVAIAVDGRTNTVIVAGKEESLALVDVLAQRIDSDIQAGWIEPRLVPLRHADATDLAETLNAILVDGSVESPQASPIQNQIGRLRMARMDENGGRVIESDVFQPMIRLIIRAEPQLNALVLVGTPMNIEIVTELAHMLDVEEASPSAVVRIYPVKHASAERLALTITDLFDQQVESKAIRPEDRVIVQADLRTNSLVVTTSPRSFAVLEQLLSMLDTEVAPDLREIRRVELASASASRIAPLIQNLMDARLDRLRKVQPETADLEQATIMADPRTNSLVIAAGDDSFEVVRRLAADLDTVDLGDSSLLEVLPLETGNVDRIAETIDSIMERRYAELPPELRESQKPLLLTDPRSNSLLVAANPEDLTAIQKLVTQLGAAPANPAIGLHVLALKDPARAEMLAPRLQRLMRERQESLGDAGTPSDRITIEPDLSSNSLIVAASDENLAVIEGFINVLVSTETAGEREVDVISLTQGLANDVVALLDDLYVQEANRTRGANTVRVTADERLNAVVVNAPAADVKAIRDLVDQLDGTRPARVVEIKYIPLSSANALETVSLIENVLSGRGIGRRQTSEQATVVKYLRQIAGDQQAPDEGLSPDQMTEMQVSTAVRDSITLTPDLRTNTIIVSAPSASMPMITQMIQDLDDSSVGAQRIRIFKLTNADAIAMAEILTELFSLERRNDLYVLKPRNEIGVDITPGILGETTIVQPFAGLSETELTAVPDERQQLAITVDTRTNSLLVSGSPTYLDLVTQVVEELDGLQANERETLIYSLNNADALEVARVLTQFVDEEQRKLLETLSPNQLGSAARLLEREVTIVGDQKSNTVLVSASPRYINHVTKLIQELDIDPPQVLIQVLLAEVTLDNILDWGVDMSLNIDVGDNVLKAGFGLANAFVTQMGAPFLAVTGGDFKLVINALEEQGRLAILSNPSIVAANNEPAKIQIGQTIYVASGTSFAAASQQTLVTPQELGIILTVTPSINPDGFVKMVIAPEISNLTEQKTKVTEDLETPVINRRIANTTVTVKDGQTIFLGGLVSNRFENRQKKVPLLGDLPLIGPLFRAEKRKTLDTEFLIVLTPHVIETPTTFDQFTQDEINRLSVPTRVRDQLRQSRLDGQLFDEDGKPVGRYRYYYPKDLPAIEIGEEEK